MSAAFTCYLTTILVQFHQEEALKEERKRFRAYMKEKERNAKRIAEEAKNQAMDKVNGKIDGDVIEEKEENMDVDDKDDQSGGNLVDKHEHKRD